MKFKIPFTVSEIEKLKYKSSFFKTKVRPKKNSPLNLYLKNSDTTLTREQYISICLRSFVLFFIVTFIISTSTLAIFQVKLFYVYSIPISLLISIYVSFNQLYYPKTYATRKQKNIEKNLIPALEDMLVQLNSGIPLFSILVNLSIADYGELSNEFKKIVRKINAGYSQIDVLEEIGEQNPSIFFRRALWQISNGMKAGSDITVVVSNSIKSLNEEQLIQIQNYGNKLNPMIMFYMLVSVILPALAITFLTVISSMIGLSEAMATIMYIGLFVGVVFIQILFLGIIRSLRPSLF